jgi:hypothetical protein
MRKLRRNPFCVIFSPTKESPESVGRVYSRSKPFQSRIAVSHFTERALMLEASQTLLEAAPRARPGVHPEYSDKGGLHPFIPLIAIPSTKYR